MPIKEYKLEEKEREELLAQIPPKYSDTVADHITYEYSTILNQYSLQNPPEKNNIEIIGVANDGNGLQALIVRLDGELQKEGGSIYHITWSLEKDKEAPEIFTGKNKRNYKPVDSNTLVKNLIDSNGEKLTPPNPDWKIELFEKPIKINPKPTNVLLSSDINTMSGNGISK